jgi:hypothetical protein
VIEDEEAETIDGSEWRWPLCEVVPFQDTVLHIIFVILFFFSSRKAHQLLKLQMSQNLPLGSVGGRGDGWLLLSTTFSLSNQ